MIDLELTPKIKEWLETEPSKRNLQAGAELLLRASRNRILYANVTRNIKAKASTIVYHLNKIYQQRLRDITREQVHSMMVEVEAIDRARGLSKPQSSAPRSDFQRGKRADHEDLPQEIQQLYVDNAEIMRRMRECHLRLRLITPENSTCPDSDRFPFAKEIIALDKQYRENWNKYDHYIKGTPISAIQLASDPRSESAKAAKLCNLLLGKYAKSPSDELAERIRTAYAKVDSPTDALTQKMKVAELL